VVESELQQRQHRTLGGRCTYWTNRCGGSLPSDYKPRLLETRNSATHEGLNLSRSQAEDAITVATEIVAQAHPLPVATMSRHLLVSSADGGGKLRQERSASGIRPSITTRTKPPHQANPITTSRVAA
jgi:hypothetical protein